MAGALNKFDCAICPKSARAAWGCEKDAPHPFHVLNGEAITRCPVTMITPDTRRMMSLWSHYKNGYLPARGGILDQTAYYYRAIEILDISVNKITKEMMDKDREKFKAKQPAKQGSIRSPRRASCKIPRRRR